MLYRDTYMYVKLDLSCDFNVWVYLIESMLRHLVLDFKRRERESMLRDNDGDVSASVF